MIGPNPTDKEKKHWVTAAYHTCFKYDIIRNLTFKIIQLYDLVSINTSGVAIFSHCGVIKNKIPALEPGSVTPRISSVMSTT